MPVQGQWNILGFNLPDFGITEKLGLGTANPNYVPQQQPSTSSLPVSNAPFQQNLSSGVLGVSNAPQQTFGNVMRETGLGMGPQNYISSGGFQAPSGTQNPGGRYENWPQWQIEEDLRARQQQEEAARQAYGAENSRLNTQFDYMAEQGQNQLGALGTQQQSELGGVETGLGDIRRQVGVAKTNTSESGAKQIKEAGSIARSTQGQNRNVLRALGILNSSAAGQILAKPMNTFDTQRAEIGQFIVRKSAELDDFVTQKVAEADKIKQDITAKYTQLTQQIQTDLRFNERQRNDALQSANAAFQQHLTQLAQNTMQYQQQAQQQKQALLANLAASTNYSNPTLNTALYQTLGLAPQQTRTPGIVQSEEERRRQLGQA